MAQLLDPFARETGNASQDPIDPTGSDSDQLPTETSSWLLPVRQAAIQTKVADLQAEIEILREEARAIEAMGRLVTEEGPPLAEAVRSVFASCGFDAELALPETPYDVIVRVDESKSLAIVATACEQTLTNRSSALSRVFEASQTCGDTSRVVVAVNAHRARPLPDREWLDPTTPEALMIVTGLGAALITTASLLRIWILSLDDPHTATDQLLQLHTSAPGTFVIERGDADARPPEDAGTGRHAK